MIIIKADKYNENRYSSFHYDIIYKKLILVTEFTQDFPRTYIDLYLLDNDKKYVIYNQVNNYKKRPNKDIKIIGFSISDIQSGENYEKSSLLGITVIEKSLHPVYIITKRNLISIR